MCPVSDALFIEFWAISPRYATKKVVDGWANTILCTKTQSHFTGNSHNAVVDGCSLFVVEVRSIWKKGECTEGCTSFCDETIENILVSVLFLCSKSSFALFALLYLSCSLVVLWFIPKGIPLSQEVLISWTKRVQFAFSLVCTSGYSILGVAQSLYGVLIDECQVVFESIHFFCEDGYFSAKSSDFNILLWDGSFLALQLIGKVLVRVLWHTELLSQDFYKRFTFPFQSRCFDKGIYGFRDISIISRSSSEIQLPNTSFRKGGSMSYIKAGKYGRDSSSKIHLESTSIGWIFGFLDIGLSEP